MQEVQPGQPETCPIGYFSASHRN
uniref:Uncharacterized protein n=1 Tax=Rhizophora mucronata TaxID=61149 RepID=A0A2P2J5Q5_RHIMU